MYISKSNSNWNSSIIHSSVCIPSEQIVVYFSVCECAGPRASYTCVREPNARVSFSTESSSAWLKRPINLYHICHNILYRSQIKSLPKQFNVSLYNCSLIFIEPIVCDYMWHDASRLGNTETCSNTNREVLFVISHRSVFVSNFNAISNGICILCQWKSLFIIMKCKFLLLVCVNRQNGDSWHAHMLTVTFHRVPIESSREVNVTVLCVSLALSKSVVNKYK